MLRSRGFTEGLFLVRGKGGGGGGSQKTQSFVLSMVQRGQPLHLLLEAKENEPFTINGDTFGNVRTNEPSWWSFPVAGCFAQPKPACLM